MDAKKLYCYTAVTKRGALTGGYCDTYSECLEHKDNTIEFYAGRTPKDLLYDFWKVKPTYKELELGKWTPFNDQIKFAWRGKKLYFNHSLFGGGKRGETFN